MPSCASPLSPLSTRIQHLEADQLAGVDNFFVVVYIFLSVPFWPAPLLRIVRRR